MRVIAELYDEHRLLEQQAAELLQVVAADYPDPASVAALRWQMAQALREHCVREDRAVYGRMMDSGDASVRPIAWYYRRDHDALTRDFTAYIADWPVARIGREWPRFRADTERTMSQLTRRIEREEAVLYPNARRVIGHADAGEHIGRAIQLGDACPAFG